jgi:glycosyltransferase A (GT-A) superfamily protein (DUF2064 family)
MPQGDGDLGDRMKRVFRSFPQGPTLIIGADIPAIKPSHIVSAFRALGQNDAVFGPATDGGYWLIGLRGGSKPTPQTLFKDVRWSSEYALADTIASLGPSARIARITTLRDVDTIRDLPAKQPD